MLLFQPIYLRVIIRIRGKHIFVICSQVIILLKHEMSTFAHVHLILESFSMQCPLIPNSSKTADFTKSLQLLQHVLRLQ